MKSSFCVAEPSGRDAILNCADCNLRCRHGYLSLQYCENASFTAFAYFVFALAWRYISMSY